MATGCAIVVSSHAKRKFPTSKACALADTQAASSPLQRAKICSFEHLLNDDPDAPTETLSFRTPHALHSTRDGCTFSPGVMSPAGKKYRRISKSKSTHSCTM